MMFEALPEETADLREVIRPLACQHPTGDVLPAVTFGRAVDEWLNEHDVDLYFYLPIFQARLYSVNRRAFAAAMDRELGWPRDESEELWDLMQFPWD